MSTVMNDNERGKDTCQAYDDWSESDNGDLTCFAVAKGRGKGVV